MCNTHQVNCQNLKKSNSYPKTVATDFKFSVLTGHVFFGSHVVGILMSFDKGFERVARVFGRESKGYPERQKGGHDGFVCHTILLH